MKFLKLYEDFDFNEDDFDFEEEDLSGHEELRNTFEWKSIGKNKKPLKDLNTSHIINIIKYVNKYKKSYGSKYQYIINTMKSELEYRKNGF